MLIKPWSENHEKIDAEFGWNDALIIFTEDGYPDIKDAISPDLVSKTLLPYFTDSDGNQIKKQPLPDDPLSILQNKNNGVNHLYQNGDILYRLGDYALLRRRSLFTDAPEGRAVIASHIMPMSVGLARALAYFSGTYKGEQINNAWFHPDDSLVANDVQTPWDFGTSEGISAVTAFLENILQAWLSPKNEIENELAQTVTVQDLFDAYSFLNQKKAQLPNRPFTERTEFHLTTGGIGFAYLMEWYAQGFSAANGKILQNFIRPLKPANFAKNLSQLVKTPFTNFAARGGLSSTARLFKGGLASAGALFVLDGIFDLANSDYEESVHRRVYDLVEEAGTGFFLFNWIRAGCHALAPTAYAAAVTNDNDEVKQKILSEDREFSIKVRDQIKSVLQSLVDQNIPLESIESGLMREYPFEWNSALHDTLVLADPIAAKKEYEYSDEELESKVERAIFEGVQEQIKILRFIDQPVNEWSRNNFLEDGRLKLHGLKSLFVDLDLQRVSSEKTNEGLHHMHLLPVINREFRKLEAGHENSQLKRVKSLRQRASVLRQPSLTRRLVSRPY